VREDLGRCEGRMDGWWTGAEGWEDRWCIGGDSIGDSPKLKSWVWWWC
jgi:hypothetical protein